MNSLKKENIYCIKVDELGNFLEPVFVEVELDENNNYTLPQYHYLPYDSTQVFHKPKINFDTGEWEESLSQQEVDELMNQPEEPTDIELLGGSIATLVEEMFDFKVTYNSVPCQAHQDYPALISGIEELVNPKDEPVQNEQAQSGSTEGEVINNG